MAWKRLLTCWVLTQSLKNWENRNCFRCLCLSGPVDALKSFLQTCIIEFSADSLRSGWCSGPKEGPAVEQITFFINIAFLLLHHKNSSSHLSWVELFHGAIPPRVSGQNNPIVAKTHSRQQWIQWMNIRQEEYRTKMPQRRKGQYEHLRLTAPLLEDSIVHTGWHKLDLWTRTCQVFYMFYLCSSYQIVSTATVKNLIEATLIF